MLGLIRVGKVGNFRVTDMEIGNLKVNTLEVDVRAKKHLRVSIEM
jgi:hypothetical protein